MAIVHIGNNIYLGLSSDTKPTTAPSTALFIETDNRRIYIYNGTIWQELIYAGTGSSDLKVLVKQGGSIIGAGLGRSINFATTTDFDVTEDTGNDEYDISIADNAIGDAKISAHTSTKITITNKSQLPATTVYTDQSNTFTSGNVYNVGNTFEGQNVFEIEQRHDRIAATPTEPPSDTGLRYLKQIDSDTDSFFDYVKVGGVFVEVRDF